MKNLIILFITFISFTSIGQRETQRDYLVCYGQIWGFLKYFHPEPSNQDWDKVLLDDFENVKNCSTHSEFNVIITDLINVCGTFTPKKRSVSDSLKFAASYEWMESDLISNDNKSSLNHLLQNKPDFKNKYIRETYVGKPEIVNEVEHANFSNSAPIQFLALTRYWNIINYYCPNRDVIPRNWSKVYKDHVGDFINAETYEDYYYAVKKVVSEIRDGHGIVKTENDPMSKTQLAPFYCQNVSDGYFITYVSQDSLNLYDIERMDRIVSIDGISIEEKIKQIGTFESTSNDYFLSKLTYYLGITDSDSMSLTLDRSGQLIQTTVPTINRELLMKKNRSKATFVEPSPYAFLVDSISGIKYCYINMGKLERSDINGEFKRALYKTDQIIIDSRNYPNWTLIKLSKVLIKGKRKFALFKEMDFEYPGAYKWTESQTIGNKRKGYDGDIYVLVDYQTMSQAEYTVMAFQQHPNTKVIGGQTAGADGDVSEIALPFGITTKFSGLGVFYPDRTPAQQVGVRRDYQIVQNKSYIEEQKDLIFEKALELIRQNNAYNRVDGP